MADRTDVKIFIASSGELDAERKETVMLITELNKRYPHLHLDSVLFEFDTAAGNNQFKARIQDAINPLLAASDIVLVLFYSKVGEFTKEELDLAMGSNKKVFVYFKDGFTPKNIEELMTYAKVLALKEEMDKESSVRYRVFKTLTEFNGQFSKDLAKHIDEHFKAPESATKTSELTSSSYQHIPLAPRPYLAHPYALPQNFTGRSEEMRQLTEWQKFEKEPMCIVEAIGGMGKSALTWKWLQDEVIAKDIQLEGIVWWSFYDQGFEEFVHHLYEYCVPESRRKQQTRIDELTEVITALANHRFLLVLDGFERVLRGYAQMMAMYIQERGFTQQRLDAAIQEFDVQQRTPITPKAEKLLKVLCVGQTKTLMTTRLFPATLERLAGIKHIQLTGLSKTDTIAFFKAEGISGTDDEIVKAGAIYNYHPLMLKQLSTAINRTFKRSIDRAFSNAFAEGLINDAEPQKILITSFNLLNNDEQKVATAVSVFRTAFKMNAAQALFPDMGEDQLEAIIRELCNLGFVMYSPQQQTFDFHPIMRAFLYDALTTKEIIHDLALSYFSKLPARDKVVTLADLEPVIEQYHHLVAAKKYVDAYYLYRDRLNFVLLYQLAQFDLIIRITQQLFLKGGEEIPFIITPNDQSVIFNRLGICLACNGQLDKAGKNFLRAAQISYKDGCFNLLRIFLGFSGHVYAFNCQFVMYFTLMQKAMLLPEAEKGYDRVYTNYLTGDIMSKQQRYLFTPSNNLSSAVDHYFSALKYSVENQEYATANFICNGLSSVYLNEAENSVSYEENSKRALMYGLQSFHYAEKWRVLNYPAPVHFLTAFESIGKCLIGHGFYKQTVSDQNHVVYFYDEHFQNIMEEVTITQDSYLKVAERIIHEGLILSRKVNRVFNECTFLLLLAQTEWLKIRDKEKGIEHFTEVIKATEDTHALAARIGYRINLADLHLFCAECLIEMKELRLGDIDTLLKLTAKEHLVKAREYARDISEYNDLFLPPDGSADEFYKGIPEYEMLKRGMTEEERVKNGYYVAWLKAERLEKRAFAVGS